MSGARIEIDLDAFKANVTLLAATVSPARTMLAVKANAYGHGLVPLALAALESGADSLAVLEVPAGLALRQAGVTAPLFAWLHGPETDFAAAIRAQIDLGVSAIWQLDAIVAAVAETAAAADPATSLRAQVHLKIDTGLHRNGAHPDEWPALVAAAVSAQAAGLIDVAAIWSHLADASPDDDQAALERFSEAVQLAGELGCVPELLHLAASSAGLRMPAARLGLVRFGIAAYGISPFADVDAAELGLRPVMSMRAPVTAIASGVATVDVGSADGIQIPAIGAAFVAVAGMPHPIITLGIDSLTIDASDLVEVGGEVTIFGPGDNGEPTTADWANWGSTIGDEIVARAGERLPRVYLET